MVPGIVSQSLLMIMKDTLISDHYDHNDDAAVALVGVGMDQWPNGQRAIIFIHVQHQIRIILNSKL